MDRVLKRRDFLLASAMAAGAVLVRPAGVSAGAMPEMKGYAEIDPNLFRGLNRVKNPKERTLLEKKHAPLIEVPQKIRTGEPFAVTVTVGEVLHPMSAPHFIQYVEIFAGNEPAGRMEFRPEFNQPKAVFTLILDRPVTLVAREYCNLHGLWESRQELMPG